MSFFPLFANDFKVFLPEIYLISIICVLVVYGTLYSSSTAKFQPILLRNLSWLALLSLGITSLLALEVPIPQAQVFHNCFIHDEFTRDFKLFTLGVTMSCILISQSYFKRHQMNSFEHILLMLFACVGMLFLISAYDLISFFLSMELQSFCLYVLAASKRKCSYSTEAGLKYFILGAFASGILLFGSTFLYGFTGITNFEEFGKFFATFDGSSGVSISDNRSFNSGSGAVLLLGILFFIIGLLFKMTAAPFHMWSPDVYEGAPTSVTAFFSTAPKLAILSVFLRIAFVSFYDLFPNWSWVLLLSGIASLGVSCFTALGELKMKRLLAFSSIGHVGLLLLGMACGTTEGVQAVIFYIIIYTIMTLNFFAGVLSLDARVGQRWQVNPSYFYIHDLHRLLSSNPLLSFNFSTILFSMAGIPPLAGFCSKFFIFSVLLNASLYSAALIGVITSVISSFYYLRLIKIMYFEKKEKSWVCYEPMSRENSLILGLSLGFVLVFFLYPSPLLFCTQLMSCTILR